jgi:beta-aspartyl-peptidase (threonine type)
VIIVSSSNGIVGIKEAMRVLREGGSAVDAVETGIRRVEANPKDHSVGFGGYPNLLGQVEVDAGIMDGRDLTAGAVGAVQNVEHPISVARKVMELLPHVFLVGRGAERFAADVSGLGMGSAQRELLTEDARQTWEERLRTVMPEEVFRQLPDLPDLHRWVEIATDPERAKGTINFLAQDAQGKLCAGTSTSGWAWKYPGRLGDSPIIGAGLYADNRYGAVACTGMGEMAIRAGTALSTVHYLKMGLTLAQAGRQAMADLNDLGGRYRSQMHLLAVDPEGRHAGFSSEQGKLYLFMTDEMQEPEEATRLHIPVQKAWG